MFNWSASWSKRTHKGLRHWILYMLQDSPRNGAEIMDSMEAMSRGWWRPSPGSVYPLLEAMASEGIIRKLPDNKYEITAKGKEEIDWPRKFRSTEPRSVEEVLEQMSGYVSYLEDLSKTRSSELSASAQKLRNLSDRLDKLGGN